MKVKRVVDQIKLKNIKHNSINASGLKGLRRVNNVLFWTITLGITGSTLWFIGRSYYRSVIYATTEGKKLFLKNLDNLPNKAELYLNAHKQLITEYYMPRVRHKLLKFF